MWFIEIQHLYFLKLYLFKFQNELQEIWIKFVVKVNLISKELFIKSY